MAKPQSQSRNDFNCCQGNEPQRQLMLERKRERERKKMRGLGCSESMTPLRRRQLFPARVTKLRRLRLFWPRHNEKQRGRRSSIVHQATGNWELGTENCVVVRLPRVMTGPRVVSLKGERCVRLWAGDAGVLTMMWMIGVFWRSQQAEEFPTRFWFSMNCNWRWRSRKRRNRKRNRGRRRSWSRHWRIGANVRRCRRVALYDDTAETFV